MTENRFLATKLKFLRSPEVKRKVILMPQVRILMLLSAKIRLRSVKIGIKFVGANLGTEAA